MHRCNQLFVGGMHADVGGMHALELRIMSHLCGVASCGVPGGTEAELYDGCLHSTWSSALAAQPASLGMCMVQCTCAVSCIDWWTLMLICPLSLLLAPQTGVVLCKIQSLMWKLQLVDVCRCRMWHVKRCASCVWYRLCDGDCVEAGDASLRLWHHVASARSRTNCRRS